MLSQYLRLFTQTGIYPDGGADLTVNPPDPLIDMSLHNQSNVGIPVDFNYLYIAQHFPFVNLFWLMDEMNSALTVVPVIAVATPYSAVGPVDEIQSISLPTAPTSGSFTLSYAGNTTASLAYNVSAADMQIALRLLAGLSTVTVALVGGTYLVTFAGIASPTILSITPTALVTSNPSKLKIEYWDGSTWRQAVDVLDSSNGLYAHGMTQFSLRNNYNWAEIANTDDDSGVCPVNLKGLFINDCYWMRVSFITTGIYKAPNPLTTIKRICYSFSTTAHINSVDIEGPSYYESFEDNKTDWVNEIIHCSEEMVSDLKRIGFIKSAGQIIEFDEIYLACAYKTLAHIYFQLGKAYTENRLIMSAKYEKAITSKALTFDIDQDGKIAKDEINATESRMVR